MKRFSFYFYSSLMLALVGSQLSAQDCSQMQESNAFENGNFIEAGGQRLANDFIVSLNATNFEVDNITANFLSQGGVASVDVIFYADNAGMPGTEISSQLGVVPTSQEIIGDAFDFDVHSVVLDLTPVDFAGNGSTDVTYWVQLVATPVEAGTQVAWETTTASTMGNYFVFDNDGNETIEWVLGNADGVFSISGTCTYMACPAPFEVMANATSTTTADISWSEFATATEWEIEYGPLGFTPGTGTVIAVTGTPEESITDLNAGTAYDVYVKTICGEGDESINSPLISFLTPCLEEDQCAYTFILMDDFGDGWNGGSMNVMLEGVTIATLGMPAGAELEVIVPVCAGLDLELVWTNLGGYPEEVGVQIEDAYGIILYTLSPPDGLELAAGTVLYTAPVDCTPPSCPQPDDLTATVDQSTAELSWTETGDATEWEVIYGVIGFDPEEEGTVVADNDGTLGVTLDDLAMDSSFDFYVKAICGEEDESFLVGPYTFSSAYCALSFSDVEPITLVQFAGIDNVTDAALGGIAHEYFLDMEANINQGSTFEIALEGNTGGNYITSFTVFMDWNQDGEFNNEDERYEVGSVENSTGTDGQQAIGNILVPTEANLGSTRMRVIKRYQATYATDGCTAGSIFGQAEDYTVIVGEPTSVAETAFNDFSFYPNPVNDQINLRAESAIQDVVIYDVVGKIVSRTQPNSVISILDLSNLTSGAYVMRLTINGEIGSYTFIKQ